jgi:hypothetical protein
MPICLITLYSELSVVLNSFILKDFFKFCGIFKNAFYNFSITSFETLGCAAIG